MIRRTVEKNSEAARDNSGALYAGLTQPRRHFQAAVFLTGLLLTFVIYASLNIFIRHTLDDEYRNITEDTQDSISHSLQDLEYAVRTISSLTALSGDANPDALQKRVIYAVAHTGQFDALFLIKKDNSGRWQIMPLSANNSEASANYLQAADFTNKLRDYAVAHTAANGSVTITTELPGGPYMLNHDGPPQVREQPFLFLQHTRPNEPDSNIVVGVGRVSAVIADDWLKNRVNLQEVIVRDVPSQKEVYIMKGAPAGVTRKPSSDYSFPMGGSRWQLEVAVGEDVKSVLLERIPLLMLLAGLLLTAAATMYVRNNQRQAFRIFAMNRVLAQKNKEMNSEIVERERLNQALRKAEREYTAMIDSVSDIIFETSIDGTLLFLNSTWEKITNFAVDQALNRKLFDMLHPQDQEEQRRSFEQMVKGHRAAYRTYARVRTANGTFRAMELAVSMLRQDETRNMRVVGTLTDVEERRRAERALGEAEKKYRTIVENAAGGIYQVTPEGQFLSANPSMARILGYDSSDQMLRQVKNAHEDLYESRQDRNRYITELEKYGVAKNFETQVQARDGRKIWVNENARAVKDDEGNILYFEGSMEDITKRKEVEIKLREAKIQSDLASRAKSEFLANMSHELRTPLNAIIGFSEIIKDEVLGAMQNRQYLEYSCDIYDSGKKLLSIINEILDVSRIEAGERQLNEGVVDLGKVSLFATDFMAQKADAGRLTITTLMDDKTPKIIGEELAVKQILLNLLSNAIKFTPPGGRVTLSYEVDGDGQLRVSVSDTGVGLDEAEIKKALSPFGQVETSLSRTGSGTGLGLTLVDSLIKLHGGRLELFSQKGLGTTATIIFPARRVVQENV